MRQQEPQPAAWMLPALCPEPWTASDSGRMGEQQAMLATSLRPHWSK